MPELLPNTLTPIRPTELAGAIVAAWRLLFRVTPARDSVLVLMAQSAHETGRWKSTHNFNIGNIKSVDGDGRDYTMFRCREVVGGKTVWFDPPHPATRFRAFRSLAEGTVDHLAFLRGRTRYAAAWKAIEAGAPTVFAAALKAGGYYTDPVEVYSRALGSFFAEFDKTLPLELGAPWIDEATRARTMALVALSLRDLAGEVDAGWVSDDEPPPRDPTA